MMDSSRNWLEGPCAFYLTRSYATKCCACDKPFGFVNRGRACEFCGYYCHKNRSCSRKMWLTKEVLGRRICSTCDRYRKLRKELTNGAEFVLCRDKVVSSAVTMTLDEATGSLLIRHKEGKAVEAVNLNQVEGVRRGFSLGGRLGTTNYDPLRSLSLTLHKSRQELATYNLRASSAWNCQLWVDGLLAAQYVYKRLEEQQLAREWYHRDGRTPHTAGSRICRNYLPKNSKLKQLRQERQLSNKPSSSLCSNDPGVGSAGGSLDNVNFDPLESYVDIEIAPDSMEVTSRELHPFLLFPRLSTMSCSVMTLPATPQVTTPPLPVLTESIDLSSQSGPLLPHSQSCEPAFLCSCHAYQMVTIEWANGSDCRRPRSAGTSPKLSQSGRCCHHCKGQCSTLLKDS